MSNSQLVKSHHKVVAWKTWDKLFSHQSTSGLFALCSFPLRAMKEYTVRLLKCAFVNQLKSNHGKNQKKIRVKKRTGEIRGRQQTHDVSARISLSTHIPCTKLIGHCQAWDKNKINLKKYYTHKKSYCDIRASEQLLQKETPVHVCLFANEQPKLSKNMRLNTGWRNINRKAAWKRE